MWGSQTPELWSVLAHYCWNSLSLSLLFFFPSVLGAGPRLRASDCATRLRLQVDYSRWTPPPLVVALRLAEAHFHGKPEQSVPPNRTSKCHISLGEERLARFPRFWNQTVGLWEPCVGRGSAHLVSCAACRRVRIVDVRSCLTIHFYISRLSSRLWEATGVHGVQAGSKLCLFLRWPESICG